MPACGLLVRVNKGKYGSKIQVDEQVSGGDVMGGETESSRPWG
jgi:hypothetical protein